MNEDTDNQALGNPEILLSEHLALVSISVSELIELAKEPDAFYLFKLRVPYVLEDPSNNRWLFRRIRLREDEAEIGLTSFHGPPDDRGMIEIGFEISESHRNQGFGTEAVRLMFSWAARQPEVKILRYTVSAENLPSMRVIEKLGFSHVGQQIDEQDGPEEIFEILASSFLEG